MARKDLSPAASAARAVCGPGSVSIAGATRATLEASVTLLFFTVPIVFLYLLEYLGVNDLRGSSVAVAREDLSAGRLAADTLRRMKNYHPQTTVNS